MRVLVWYRHTNTNTITDAKLETFYSEPWMFWATVIMLNITETHSI